MLPLTLNFRFAKSRIKNKVNTCRINIVARMYLTEIHQRVMLKEEK